MGFSPSPSLTGGIWPPSRPLTRSSSRLSPLFPATTAGPLSPPSSSDFAVSARSPAFCSEAPWQGSNGPSTAVDLARVVNPVGREGASRAEHAHGDHGGGSCGSTTFLDFGLSRNERWNETSPGGTRLGFASNVLDVASRNIP